jgi:hypothetical protein
MGAGLAQAAEHLLSKCEALSSKPSTTKKEKNMTWVKRSHYVALELINANLCDIVI